MRCSMLEFVILIRDFWVDLIDLLNSIQLTVGAIKVPLGGLIFAFLVVGIVISVFWKGAKT